MRKAHFEVLLYSITAARTSATWALRNMICLILGREKKELRGS